MNISYLYLLIDEIDHITIAYREWGKGLDRRSGINKIQYCLHAFPAVEAAFEGRKTRVADLETLTDDELHDVLVFTREALIKTIK